MKNRKKASAQVDYSGKPGPKLMGEEKRVRTTLCFDPGMLERAKDHAASIDKSLSLWIEELMKPHLGW